MALGKFVQAYKVTPHFQNSHSEAGIGAGDQSLKLLYD